MKIDLFIIVLLVLIIGCKPKKNDELPYELDSISTPKNGLKIVIVDSIYKVINTGKIAFVPPGTEIGILDISHHFPEYAFKFDSSGILYISEKKKSTLKVGNLTISEGYYINGMCLCKFSANDKLVILKENKYDCEIIKQQ